MITPDCKTMKLLKNAHDPKTIISILSKKIITQFFRSLHLPEAFSLYLVNLNSNLPLDVFYIDNNQFLKSREIQFPHLRIICEV